MPFSFNFHGFSVPHVRFKKVDFIIAFRESRKKQQLWIKASKLICVSRPIYLVCTFFNEIIYMKFQLYILFMYVHNEEKIKKNIPNICRLLSWID